MVSLLKVTNNPNIQYKTPENTTTNNSSPVSDTVPAVQENISTSNYVSVPTVDEVVLGAQPKVKGKSGGGNTIAKSVGGLLVATTALVCAYKWKGDKWLNKEAYTTGDKIKNWLMKPGEWMEKGFNKLRGKGKVKPEGETTLNPKGQTTSNPKGETTQKLEGETTPKPEGETTPNPEGEPTPKLEGETTPNPEGKTTSTHEGETTPNPEGETAIEKLENRVKSSSNITRTSPDGDPIPIIEFNSPQKVDVINDEEIAKFVERCRAEGIDFKSGVSVGLYRVEPDDTKWVKGRDANYVMITIYGHCEDGILPIVSGLYKANSVSKNIEKELNSITQCYIMNIK